MREVINSPLAVLASVSMPFTGATVFVDGNRFPLPAQTAGAAEIICRSPRLSPRELGPALEGDNGDGVEVLLHALLREGFLYPADD